MTLRDDDAALASVTERHFSAQAIARHFGISPDLVLAEQDRGEMAYVRFGKRRVVPESALLAYVRAHAFGDHPSRPLPPEPVKRGRGRRA